MSTKICKKCGKEKPLSEYNVNKKAKDGLQSYCKECQSEYFKANADKIRERYRQWRAEKKLTQAAKVTPVKAKPAIYLGLQSFNLIEAERALISRAMRENPQMTQFEIAQLCGVSERTLQGKLEEFGLKKPGIPIGGGSFSTKDYKQKKLCECIDRELLEELWDRGFDGHFWKYVKQESNLSKLFNK